jgi:hypothetical protein
MGNVKTGRVMRKATFEVTEAKGVRVYTPVNKRAHDRALTVIGKRKGYGKADLKKIARVGKVRVYIYTSAGLRKAVA